MYREVKDTPCANGVLYIFMQIRYNTRDDDDHDMIKG